MAKVFTDVEVVNRQIPDPADFEVVGERIMDHMSERSFAMLQPGDEPNPFWESCIGGMVFGSTIYGRANRRSDLDVLIVNIDGGNDPADIYRRQSEALQAVAAPLHVPVEPLIVDRMALFAGRHTIDPLFAAHLESVTDPWVWGKPLEFMQFVAEPQDTFVAYAVHKEAKFKKALAAGTDNIDHKVFQRAFELPGALGRKTLQFLNAGDIHARPNMPKAEVILHFQDLGLPRTEEPLTKLLTLDADYDAMLDRTLEGKASIWEYKRWLDEHYSVSVSAALNLAYFALRGALTK